MAVSSGCKLRLQAVAVAGHISIKMANFSIEFIYFWAILWRLNIFRFLPSNQGFNLHREISLKSLWVVGVVGDTLSFANHVLADLGVHQVL